METVRIVTRVLLGTGTGKLLFFVIQELDSNRTRVPLLVIGLGYAGLRCRHLSIVCYHPRRQVLPILFTTDQSKSAEQMYEARREQVDPVLVPLTHL